MDRRHGPSGETASATIALASAGVFILVAASLGLTLDRDAGPSSAWSLRGSLVSGASAPGNAAPPRIDHQVGHTTPDADASVG